MPYEDGVFTPMPPLPAAPTGNQIYNYTPQSIQAEVMQVELDMQAMQSLQAMSDGFQKGASKAKVKASAVGAIEKARLFEKTVVLEAKPGFKFGCDPELFVRNADGVYVTAEGLIPGTKAEPFPVELGAVQVDGMAAEFNIDPATTFEEWDRNISHVLKQLQDMLPEGYTLHAIPSVKFTEEEFSKAPDCAKELGCSPDFNAWSGDVNSPPRCTEIPTLRTASGHIHIGWTEEAALDDLQHIMNCRDLVKQLDWYLGGWSLKTDTDPTRRLLYGKAGACRYKSYGVEYRVLSNFWIMDRELRLAVWNRLQSAIDDMAKTVLSESVSSKFNIALVNSINTSSRNSVLERSYTYPLDVLDRSFSTM